MVRRIIACGAFAFAALAACTGGPGTTSSSSSTSSTSSSSSGGADGGAACVTIDPTTYDRSCTADSDCAILPTGTLCTGRCGCGGDAVNGRERARWTEDTSSIRLAACPCAAPGTARCVQSTCTLCTFAAAAPGCPDAG